MNGAPENQALLPSLLDRLLDPDALGSADRPGYGMTTILAMVKQDVEDLLRSGVSVITTMNVQHLESLYDVVERFTGVKVKERVPDYVLAQAHQIASDGLADANAAQ